MTDLEIWLAFLLMGLVLWLAGSVSSVFHFIVDIRNRERSRFGSVKDPVDFRAVLGRWEPFVLKKRGTIREVKRFANHARFLCTLHHAAADTGDLDTFVGLVAVDQCGLLLPMENDIHFEDWRRTLSADPSLPDGWLANLDRTQLEAYKRSVGIS